MNLFLYLILLAAAWIFYPLYENELSFAVLVTLMILPFLLLITLIYNIRTIRLGVSDESPTIFMGQKGEVRLKMINKGLLPTADIALSVRTRSMLTGREEKSTIRLGVGAGSSGSAVISADTSHCGVFRVYVDNIRFSDVFGFFSWKLRTGSEPVGEIVVIPRLDEDCEDEARSIATSSLNTENDDEPVPVSGPGDVIDFRDFRPGDRPVMIHHKLSARFDKNIVKIMGLPQCRRFLTAPDTTDGLTSDETDILLGRALSISYYIGQLGNESFVAAAERSADCVSFNGGYAVAVRDMDDYISAARTMVMYGAADISAANGFICCEVGLERSES